jgi:dephospho-CoA kinase
MKQKSIVIGLTGCIGSGKSTALKIFKKLGLETISADEIVKENYSKNKVFYNKIVSILGKDILNSDESIDRSEVTQKIINNKNLIYKINKAIHPILVKKIIKRILDLKNRRKFIIVEVPLLFELHLEKYMDIVLVIASTNDLITKRVLKSKTWTKSVLKFFQRQQLSQAQKIKKADYVIKNNGSIITFEKTIISFYKNLLL